MLSQSDEADKTNFSDNVNTSLTATEISPLNFQQIGSRDNKGYEKRKVHQVEKTIIKKIAFVGIDPNELENLIQANNA